MTVCFPTHLYFTLEEMNQFDDMPNWREALSRPMPERMARLRNGRVGYSCDRGTGVPGRTPPRA